MLRASFSVGRLMGVDLRVHVSFVALLALALGYSVALSGGVARGLGLWMALAFAVAVRETARAMAAAYAGLRLRALFLLPVGGVMALAPRGDGSSETPMLVTAAAPCANVLVGLLLIALSYAIDPRVPLLAQPWISLGHILRSVVWMQFLMAAVNLMPAMTLPGSQLKRDPEKASGAAVKTLAGSSAGVGLVAALILVGLLTMNYWPLNLWPLLLGVFLLFAGRLKAAQSLDGGEGEQMQVGEVMLTEYTLLSSSDTLQGALERTVHSLQDVFPVVRGDRLVGSVSRQTIAERLRASGDSYLQGAMTRNLQLAAPGEKLVAALRRAGAQGASEFIPVIEDGAMVGILTPQSLTRAVQTVKLARPPEEKREQR